MPEKDEEKDNDGDKDKGKDKSCGQERQNRQFAVRQAYARRNTHLAKLIITSSTTWLVSSSETDIWSYRGEKKR